MRPVRGPPGLRRGGPARRGGEGVPGAGPLGGARLRGQVPRLPHHREPGPRRPAEGGHRLRPAHPPGPSRRPGGHRPASGDVRLPGGAEPHRGPAAHHRDAPHGHGGQAGGHQGPLRPGGERPGGHIGRGPAGPPGGGRGGPPGPPGGAENHRPRPRLDPRLRRGAGAGLFRGHGAGERQAGVGDRRRRGAQHPAHRLAGGSPCWPAACPPSCRT